MAVVNPTLQALADHYGIATEFWDWKGHHTSISVDTVIKALAALDVDASTEELAEQALKETELAPWRRMVPPCVVTEEGSSASFDVHVPAGTGVMVEILTEDGITFGCTQTDNFSADREIDGRLVGEASFVTSDNLPLGYHTIRVFNGDNYAEGCLIVTPTHVGFPKSMGDRQVWGLASQLYSVRSSDSWGIGDFQDLADLCVWSSTQCGADYILINPLHAAQPVPPMDPSPYLPSSRRFINPMYIRPETIREYSALSQADRDAIADLKFNLGRQLAAMDDQYRAAHPDEAGFHLYRNESWAVKLEALQIIYQAGLRPARQMAFDQFCEREGKALADFATFCALFVELGEPNWHLWPQQYQSPSSPAVSSFRDEHADQVRFYQWLQWISASQLSSAQRTARDSGMALGVIADLAVGVNAAGADSWILDDVYVKTFTVGAPPDAYNQLGQDWGQPPLRPDRLEELAYEPVRRMISASLRHSGGLRVDHIAGLFRRWWVPKGGSSKDGVYVRYNHEAMVGVLALEAYRHQAIVIGEDLGTVEPWVREYLARRGILGTSVLWFEYGLDGKPLPPEQWREYCMASVTTHDLPPSAGYLAGDHIRLRHRLGLLTEPLDEELRHDAAEQQAWIRYLAQLGLLDNADDYTADAVIEAMHRFLTLTPSRVLNMTLVDAVGDRLTQNQPGTIDEYPNWRVPLSDSTGTPILLEQVFTLERPRQLARIFQSMEEKLR